MAFALVRAFARSTSQTVGNFWVDMTRVVLYVLLPLSIVVALVLVALGVPQTLAGSSTSPPSKAPSRPSPSGR
jgi:K+-transporting ATPase ATPase A chain